MPSSVCQSKLIFSFRACFIHRPFKSIETISESLCFWVTVPISTLTNIFSHGSAHGAVNLTIVFFDWGRYPNRFWSFTGLGSLPQLILIHFLNRVVTLINSGTFQTRVPTLDRSWYLHIESPLHIATETSQHAAQDGWCEVACFIVLGEDMLWFVVWCYVMSCYIGFCKIMLRYDMLHTAAVKPRVVPQRTILRFDRARKDTIRPHIFLKHSARALWLFMRSFTTLCKRNTPRSRSISVPSCTIASKNLLTILMSSPEASAIWRASLRRSLRTRRLLSRSFCVQLGMAGFCQAGAGIQQHWAKSFCKHVHIAQHFASKIRFSWTKNKK